MCVCECDDDRKHGHNNNYNDEEEEEVCVDDQNDKVDNKFQRESERASKLTRPIKPEYASKNLHPVVDSGET